MKAFSKLYREFKSSVTLPVLRTSMENCLKFYDRMIIVIDAVDECMDRSQLLQELVTVLRASNNLNLLVTSREEHDIKQKLIDLPRLGLELSKVTADIDCIIDAQLTVLIGTKRLKLNDHSLRGVILGELSKRADGM